MFSAAGLDGPASRTVALRVTDPGGQSDTATASVDVANVAPSSSISLATQTLQYSDTVQTVTIGGSDPLDSLTASASGLPNGLALTASGCAGTTPESCAWTIAGQIAEPAGTFTTTVSISDDDGGTTDATVEFVVQREDATVSFASDNPVAIRVSDAGGDSGSFALSVDAQEAQPDSPVAQAFPGDMGHATLSAQLVPVGPGSPVDGACTGTGVSGSGYDAVNSFACTFDTVPVNTYTLAGSVGGGYYAGSAEDVVVVYDPSLDFTTGGGWFYWPGGAVDADGYPGDRTNVGFTMKYNKKGKKVQGNLLLIRHLPDGTKYRVKSNTLDGLALGTGDDGETFGYASFAGKATYLEPGWPDPIGNHRFVAYVEDHGVPGRDTDRFWIEVRDMDGQRKSASSMSIPASGEAAVLGGGNIVAPYEEDGRNRK